MFKILIDTCVWLDLAKDYQQQAILSALEDLIRQNEISLILPRTVVEEFDRNKIRLIEESNRSLSSTFKRVKEAVEKFADPKQKTRMLRQLNEIDHRIPILGDSANGTINRIEKLFARTPVLDISDAVKLRAAQRAIDNRAPFHRQRNSMNDALLIEMYAEVSAKPSSRIRFAFITHNTKDFSHPNATTKLPHPDLVAYFSRSKSLYFTTLGEALRRVQPETFADLMIEHQWIEEPRRLTEILNAIEELTTKVWYNRHQVCRQKIQLGKIKIVEKETFPVKDHLRRPIQRDVWEGALKAAAKVEKKYGLKNLGPWDDFEWGMLNGKLSALRWMLGDEWDMLDT
ncbi:MAG: hypothetical protein A4E19_00780 [Nitrospira sp. SG-bin1]|nr:MAG: hypothetical protein A4E19_00780 [Nitrospira sp. SG-bin1]